MSGCDRRTMVCGWNAEREHQRLAGLASWAAFSARWRAHQGLPLLHPMDVQYLTPQDFYNGQGRPLSPEAQRRRFREYVEAAIGQGVTARVPAWGRRHAGVVSAELGMVRAEGFVQWMGRSQPDFAYGRADVARYAPDALRPARPYGVPVVSSVFASSSSYWLDGSVVGDEYGDDSWIDEYGSAER